MIQSHHMSYGRYTSTQNSSVYQTAFKTFTVEFMVFLCLSLQVKWGVCIAPGAVTNGKDGKPAWVSSCQSVFINGNQVDLFPWLWFPL